MTLYNPKILKIKLCVFHIYNLVFDDHIHNETMTTVEPIGIFISSCGYSWCPWVCVRTLVMCSQESSKFSIHPDVRNSDTYDSVSLCLHHWLLFSLLVLVLIDQVQFCFSKRIFLENFSVKSEIRGKAMGKIYSRESRFSYCFFLIFYGSYVVKICLIWCLNLESIVLNQMLWSIFLLYSLRVCVCVCVCVCAPSLTYLCQ